MNITIRPIAMNDADWLWKMMSALDSETEYMMYESNERTKNLHLLESLIHRSVEGDDLFVIAEANREIIGYLSAPKGNLQRIKHSAYIVVGIRASYQKQGIGTRFFQELNTWAKDKGITRLELTVMYSNLVAKHLYEKNGFMIEGTKKNSMLVNGTYVDAYYMAKLLK